MDQREERIRLETERYRITGSVTLARNGYRSRISDLLNASEREFLPLTDVTVEPLAGGEPEHHDFMAISRRHVVFASMND
ncbi:MAG TPA: hypothetical protein VGY97_00925 [Solirubrobacteraceae bacterium]|nr:hypothetical protein [Solirubrobacteraceae bacterium]